VGTWLWGRGRRWRRGGRWERGPCAHFSYGHYLGHEGTSEQLTVYYTDGNCDFIENRDRHNQLLGKK